MKGITPDTLFKVGAVCFGIISIVKVVNFLNSFEVTSYLSKVGSLADILFTIALSLSFIYMVNMSKQSFQEQEASDDIDQIIKKLNRKTKKEKHINK